MTLRTVGNRKCKNIKSAQQAETENKKQTCQNRSCLKAYE
jgi:hypothetical protein